MKRCFEILSETNRTYLGIMLDEDRLWNVDKTSVDSTFGRSVKGLGTSHTHHGEFRSPVSKQVSGKHIKAMVAVSASGRKAPPFLSFMANTP